MRYPSWDAITLEDVKEHQTMADRKGQFTIPLAARNLGRCPLCAEECSEYHRCAATKLTFCGGHRPASECKGRNYVLSASPPKELPSTTRKRQARERHDEGEQRGPQSPKAQERRQRVNPAARAPWCGGA